MKFCRIYFHEFILQKIREKPSDRIWIKDVSNGRYELFGNIPGAVSKIASGLSNLGFTKGDVLCMFCSNYVEYWLIALAAWTCGGCVMPVNCELEPKHLEKQLNETKAKIIICDELNISDALGKFHVTQCGNYGNSLSHLFDRNFVKVTFLLKKL